MTQILLHRTAQGVLLATDSRAVAFSSGSEEDSERFTVQKLFHPVSHVILLTGGAGYGIWLCEQFASHIAENGLDDASTAAEAALSFLRPLSEALKKKVQLSADSPHLDRIYILVGGIHRDEAGGASIVIRLFGAEQASDFLHEIEVGSVLTIPRQVTLEYRLDRLAGEEASPDAVERLFEKFLRNASEADDDVGGPFHFVRIQPTGIRFRTIEG